MDSSLQILRQRIRRDRQRTLVVGVIGSLVVVFLCFAPARQHEPSVGRIVVMMLVGAAAAYLMRDGLKSVDAHPGIRAIADGGHAIVWIYVLRIGRRHVHKASVLQLGLASGEIAQIELQREGDEDLLRDLLELAPHATVGYDPIYERRFRVNPAGLRRG